jgi:dihydrofolate reductase
LFTLPKTTATVLIIKPIKTEKMRLHNCLIFLLFVSIFLSSCEKEEINDSIIVEVTNQLSVDGIDYDIKLHSVSTQEEAFDEYYNDGELVLFESTSKEIDLAGSGETTVYSDTWTVHFAYKAANDSIWFKGGTAPANEIRHQTLEKGSKSMINLTTADLKSHDDIKTYRNREYSAIVHNDKIWIVGGTDHSTGLYSDASFRNEVYNSIDGINWRFTTLDENPWQGRKHHNLVSFNGKMWIIGGTIFKENTSPGTSINDIWYSDNGIDWELATENAPWAKRSLQECFVFNNKLYLVGGYPFFTNDGNTEAFKDVWSSSDGINWTSETTDTPWPANNNKTVVFNNKMWCFNSIAGWLGINANEVWSSDNGADWVQVNDSIEFAPNSNFQTAVFNNKMWIIGGSSKGLDGYTHPTNSAWYSTDGINWELATSNCLSEPIQPHSIFIYEDKLWLIEYTSLTMRICNTSDGMNWSVVE